jgi:hypothetical protein
MPFTAEVKAPDSDQTLLSTWDGKVGRLGSGSDYTVFLDVMGIPSMGMRVRYCGSASSRPAVLVEWRPKGRG